MEDRYRTLHFRINQRQVVDKWTKYFIDRMRNNLVKHKIGVTGNLNRSFIHQIIQEGGDVTAVYVKFAMYGRFVDMGVGNGLKAYERGMNKQMKSSAKKGANVSFINRKPKRWFNKIKTAQIWKLRELLAKELDHATVQNIKNELGTFTEYGIKM